MSITQISKQQITDIRLQMIKFAELQLNHKEIAEDLVQESLLSALKNITHFNRQAALKTWMFAILKNKIIDYLRQKDRWVLESELISEDEQENTFFDNVGHWKSEYNPPNWQINEQAVYSDEFWVILEICLTNLPAKQAKVFMMREYLGFSSEEICANLKITTANLRTMLYRARLQLQQCLSVKLSLGERK
ncbi:sigma-70 family RNA polymerase sigma factor [Rodentibacter pneumotropicus]|uniref:Sigma-70 family RNA polymerase sigma factor n=1 Tax=Rodentibacter pneumotropicus TaxID=758 RepID=A0A4S2PA23_9PAST|nr:sigma-70 family RNA polymerase sigma factor [Rodentibacter pneumotropicus]NBH75100.1 sigma-70 family RNA polymerase sigma factor [Rodentibacter pneumotropicus]TGZ99951.1 sigma-70 family RNA polymerase sigma factor [Rodentibacter pneumotropicus]THA00089.1 sigma-70 family RNA polymerase sigma factor [Rodentibacter pneumotropicus]THA05182.1 sigma-70 family RNA polymerase sigma factor [Rodentibacter pneumotropicus]THA07063.1 sigma-70 family RNA polymerase sigma factor [Rodentibacter pneumotropi